MPSAAYSQALQRFRALSRKHRQAAADYRARKIDDAEFLEARAKLDAASAELDQAEAAEIVAREQGTGRYAPSKFETVCECGHTLGTHTGERAKVGGVMYQECLADPSCECRCFKKSRKVKVPKARKIKTAGPKLSSAQQNALDLIGHGTRVDLNSWTSANFLIRKGLATKVPSVAPFTEEPGPEWGGRILRKPRAAYTLTDAGRALLK